MKLKCTIVFTVLSFLFCVITGCQRYVTYQKTKTELLIQNLWSLRSVVRAGMDAMHLVPPCYRDNLVRFRPLGEGFISDNIIRCNVPGPSVTPLYWSFRENETVLVVSQELIPYTAREMTLKHLSDTLLVVQVIHTPPAGPASDLVVTYH
ncbi:MAG: hypothetical protein N2747_02600 [Chitinophagaceae bacterium]|nr:hypothetical protein [Chitinophagaceae bacterium]